MPRLTDRSARAVSRKVIRETAGILAGMAIEKMAEAERNMEARGIFPAIYVDERNPFIQKCIAEGLIEYENE